MCRNVCINGSSQSFEAWTSGFHALLSTSNYPSLQWPCECHYCCAEWENLGFSNESCFNLSYNDGHVHVRCYLCKQNCRDFIIEWHRGKIPSLMIWSAMGYNIWSCLLDNHWHLKNCYILKPKVLPLLQATPHSIFSSKMSGHMWRELCKPSSNND